MNAHEYAASVPWAITEAALAGVLAAAERVDLTPDQVAAMHGPEMVRARRGEPLEGTRRADARDGVAILPVRGPLMRYATVFSSISGATSYQVLAEDFRAALEDPAVRAIVLEVDSPGGMVAGAGETAEMIFAARGAKPIVAYVSFLGCSAAYYLAAAADRVVVAPSAIVGSIGVLSSVPTRAPRRAGDPIQFVSSQSPNKVADPESREGRRRIEAEVDALAKVFVADVARFRGVPEATVVDDFGGGGTFVGRSAVDAGLADSVGSFEGLMSELARGASRPPARGQTTKAAPGGKPPQGGKSPMFGLWKKQSGAIVAQANAVDEGDELLIDNVGPAAQAPAPAPAPEAAAPSRLDELAELRRELARSKADLITTRAHAWYDGLFAADLIVPAERDAALAAHVQAALDDVAGPLPDGKSRLALVEGIYRARTPHTLCRERLDGDAAAPGDLPPGAPAGARILEPHAADPKKAPDKARVNSLISHLVAAGMAGPDALAK